MFALMYCLLFSVNATAGINVCKEATKNAETYNRILPKKVDNITTIINYIVNCEAKVIRHEKQLSVDPKMLNRSGLMKIYKKFVVKQCTTGYARYGWEVLEYYYDEKMVVAFIFIAKPENCKNQEQIDI